MESVNFENKKFNTPEEEISFLREYISNKEKTFETPVEAAEANSNNLENLKEEESIKETIREYAE